MLKKTFIACILIKTLVFPDSIKINSYIDTTEVSIGDIIKWTIKVDKLDESKELNFTNIPVSNDTFSIKSQKLIYKKNKIIGAVYEIVYWEVGEFKTPDYAVKIMDNNSKYLYSINLDRIHIKVLSILEKINDKNFRPIKGPIPVNRIIPFKYFF